MYVEHTPPLYDYKNQSIGKFMGFLPQSYECGEFEVSSVQYATANNTSTISFSDPAERDRLLNVCSTGLESVVKLYITPSNASSPTEFSLSDIVFTDGKLVVPGNVSGATKVRTNSIISDFCANLNFDDFILLHIRDLERYTANNRTVEDAFAIIPKGGTQKYFDISRNYGTIKHLDPILPQLTKLSIRFSTLNGSLYQFNNHEHKLVLAVRLKINIQNT